MVVRNDLFDLRSDHDLRLVVIADLFVLDDILDEAAHATARVWAFTFGHA